MKLRVLLLLVFMVMFVLFAVSQWNAENRLIWMPVYLAAAVLCWLAYKRKLFRWVYGTAFLLYAAAAFFMWPPVYHGLLHDGNNLAAIEEARNSVGLSICALVMAYCYLLEWRYRD
ncbi:transmembrane 220 family protein [Rufibacter psychrotolerans]|uniref:transmembrane 220 family protein n=1 Tax=Rufibacter psychrotolerans TaxID=2812556 RepID=UPI001966FF8E|nr:transmembrane 220 family protein [Rufibacter sp. SYSU D00308]